jgi:hypothetical protein
MKETLSEIAVALILNIRLETNINLSYLVQLSIDCVCQPGSMLTDIKIGCRQ